MENRVSLVNRRYFLLGSAGVFTLGTALTVQRRDISIFRSLSAARASRDVEKMVSYFTDDCVYEDETFQFLIRGKQALRAMFQSLFAGIPDSEIKIRNLFVSDGWECAQWTLTGTHSGKVLGVDPTGNKLTVNGASILKLQGKRIEHNTDYMDRYTLAKQIGLRC